MLTELNRQNLEVQHPDSLRCAHNRDEMAEWELH